MPRARWMLWEQAELARGDDSHRIVVWTKIDILPSPFGRGAGGEGVDADTAVKSPHSNPLPKGEGTFVNCPLVITSSVTGEGLDLLRAELRRIALAVETSTGDVVASTIARCHESLHRAGDSLRNARELVEAKGGEEFIAAEIRLALEELGKVVGTVYTDDVLDRIFSRFCVGK